MNICHGYTNILTQLLVFFMILKKFILALLISLLSTACSPFKAADILSPYSGYTVTKDLPYGKLHRQTLDVNTPTGKLASEDIIIFIYGGSWTSGEKSNYRFIAQPFAEAGFKTILPNYRLYPEVKFLDISVILLLNYYRNTLNTLE